MRRGTSAHGDAYVLDTAGGVAHYRPPGPMQFLFGGTGILISRGALDRNLSIFKDGAFTQHKVGSHSGCSW